MFETISFCVGEKTLELYGTEYPLGELTAEVLNITPEECHKLRGLWDKAKAGMERYEKTRHIQDWFDANEWMLQLNAALRERRIFRLIQTDESVLYEARELTGQYSLFGDDEDFVLSEYDQEVMERIADYEDYLDHPEDFGGVEYVGFLSDGEYYRSAIPRPPVPPEPPEKTRALLIVPGPMSEKWAFYKRYCGGYARVLLDISSVCQTLQAFIRMGLSHLEKLNPDNYVAALNTFLYHERAHKWIANPIDGTGFYTSMDDVRLHLIPRETSPGSGAFKVYEYYEVDSLQAMLKLDFYKGLEAGHLIRRCEFCGRYFLLQKGYHTKYCDLPNPKDPRYSCAQLGYRVRGVKETADDSPLAQALYRCYRRIDKDKSRGHITQEEQKRLLAKAEELYHNAKTTAGASYDAFDRSLAMKNLCSLCGVVRKANPRGRPKKKGLLPPDKGGGGT